MGASEEKEDKKEKKGVFYNTNEPKEINDTYKKENKINNLNQENKNLHNVQINPMTKSELMTGHKPVPINLINKVMKSICKIRVTTKEGIAYGTGFFLNYTDEMKCLITCYHVINPEVKNIEIEIWNNKPMKLKLSNRYVRYFNRPKDISIIEIKKSDEIYEDIIFLDYDYNYKKGYIIYKDADIFSIEHP